MPSRRLSPAAIRDLDELADFISRDKPLAALKFVERLESQIEWLAQDGTVGFRLDVLSPQLLTWPVGNWLILYRLTGPDIEVVRIVHGSRDLTELLGHTDESAN